MLLIRTAIILARAFIHAAPNMINCARLGWSSSRQETKIRRQRDADRN